MSRMLSIVIIALFVMVPAAADAGVENDFDVTIVERAVGGSDMPGMIFTAINDITGIKIKVTRSDGHTMNFTRESLKAGEKWNVLWRQTPGRASYAVEFRAKGLRKPLTLEFMATVATEFDISVVTDDIDLEAGQIAFSTQGNVDRVVFELFAPDGGEILTRELDLVTLQGHHRGIDYDPPAGEIGLVKITAFDPYGFKKELSFTPYSVPIPHDEVVFEFGKADVRPCEEIKLFRVIEESDKTISTLGKQIRFRLYVAGYTDTVGSPEANIDLSRRRAAAIAAWLREHGLKLPVCSRGFGESVLAVETPDDTQEEANRRTIFVISGQAPYGKDFPDGSGWSCTGK